MKVNAAELGASYSAGVCCAVASMNQHIVSSTHVVIVEWIHLEGVRVHSFPVANVFKHVPGTRARYAVAAEL